MSLGLLDNISSIMAQNNLNQTQNSLQNTLTQLSSGSRINSGADDAAGLAVADGLGANVAALGQSTSNASSGISLLQTADGALSQVTNLLNRAVTLATESANGTLNSAQVSSANQEYQNILSEVGNIGSTTNFNGNQVFTASAKTVFMSDGTTSGAQSFTETVGTLSATSVGLSAGTTPVTTTIPGISTTMTTPTATNSLATGGAATVLAAPTIVAAGAAVYTDSTVAQTVPAAVVTGAGATQAATLTLSAAAVGDGLSGSISFANAGGTVTSAVAVSFGAGQSMTAAAASANAAFTAAGATGMSASVVNGNLVIASAQGTSSGIVASADSTLDSATVSYTPSTATFAEPPSPNSLYTGTVAVAAVGSNAAVSLTLSGGTALSSVVSQLNTAFGVAAGHNVASIGGTNNDQLVITGPSGAGDNLVTSGTALTATAGTASVATFTPTGATDTLSGTISVGVGSGAKASYTVAANSTLASVVAGINGTNAFSTAGIVASSNVAGQLILTGPTGASNTLAFGNSNALVDTTAPTTKVTTPPGAGVDFAVGAPTDVSTLTAATAATVLTSVTTAIGDVAYQRGVLGANINELTAASNVASSESVNLTSAESNITSTNYGQAASDLAKYQVLSQTGISALAQANQVSQEVLKLMQ